MAKKQHDDMKGFFDKIEQEHIQVMNTCRKFYPDDINSQRFIHSSDPKALEKILDQLCNGSSPQPDVQQSLQEQCLQIQAKALSGEYDQAILSLDRGKLIIQNKSYELGNTTIKVQSTDSNIPPVYIFMKKGGTLFTRIYLSRDYPDGVMAILNEENKEVYIPLAECHVLTIQENAEARKEIGLMLSFTRVIRHVFFSIIMALNLDPIKNLLLSEWLTSEWEKAKEGNASICANLGLEGDIHKNETT